jgi:hypothetical protein
VPKTHTGLILFRWPIMTRVLWTYIQVALIVHMHM